jgi:hypothetical protein
MFLFFEWNERTTLAHVVQAIEPLSPDDPIAMAFSILLCAFAGGKPVIPVELRQVLDKVDSCWTRWIPKDYRDSSKAIGQVDRARFGCAMCYNLAARVIGMVNSKPEKESLRWIRDLNNKTKRHIDTTRWLTMYFEIGCISFHCAGDEGALDEARLCFMHFDRGAKVVRKSRHGSLPDPLEKLCALSKYYNNRIPLVEGCMRRGGTLLDVSAKGNVTASYFEKQK